MNKQSELAISFPDQSASFTHGVEFGLIMERMRRGDQTVNNVGFPVHSANEEVIRRACKEYGYIPVFGACEYEGWIIFFAIKNVVGNN